MNTTNRNVLIYGFSALVLLIIAYSNHFYNGFHFDDIHAIVNNVHIRSLKNIPEFFVNPKMFSADPSHWGLRSLVTTTLAIDYWLGGGLNPFWFQLSTFIWHILLSILVFFLYRKLLKTAFDVTWASYLALSAASWYALHEANAETINYIISRSDVLSSAMIVLSLYIFIKWPGKRKYMFYVIPAFIGVFAKETVPVLVIIMFFYLLFFERKLSFGDMFMPKNIKIVLGVIWQMFPLIFVVVITQLYTLSRIPSIPGISNPLLPYVLTQTYVWVHYFISFFLPVNLSADSDWVILKNHLDERIIIGCLFVAALLVTIIKTSKKDETRPIAFGLIWFAAALLPTSLAPFAEVTNDHRMYFPFIGLALSVITYAGLLIRRYQLVLLKGKYTTALILVMICILCLNAYGIHQRDKVWRDNESLWYDVTIKSPLNGRGLMNYGLAEMNLGKLEEADRAYKQAQPLLQYYNVLYVNMGILAGMLHKPEEAERNFKTAINLDDKDFNSFIFYARYLVSVGRVNDAQPLAEKALQLNPYSDLVLNVLMRIYDEQSNWTMMAKTANQLLAIWPADTNAKLYLSAAQKQQHISGNAKAPGAMSAEDYLNQSLGFYTDGKYEECIKACKEALKLQPNYADAYSNIGAAYNKLKQWQNAIDACKKALQINPAHQLAKGNLDFAESQLKK